MFIEKPPRFIRSFFRKATWEMNNTQDIFITFDDGPVPDITEWTVKTMNEFEAKGTFFCVGDNARKYPHLIDYVKYNGHSIGNHTYNHINGWRTSVTDYYNNVMLADEILHSRLFRPPYGRITKPQMLQLADFEIIMWDVLSVDYDSKLSGKKCINNVLKNVQGGSIVVFHDSLKASKNLFYALPKVLESLKNKGYTLSAIPNWQRNEVLAFH